MLAGFLEPVWLGNRTIDDSVGAGAVKPAAQRAAHPLVDVVRRIGGQLGFLSRLVNSTFGQKCLDLVSKGYLGRREDPSHKRAKRIYLTQKGRETAQASRIALLEVERQISEILGTNNYQEMRRNLAAISEMDL